MIEQTLLFTDLVDSTVLTESVGDARVAQIWLEHDQFARDLLARHDGREIDRADGFFLLFDNSLKAARFSIDYHRGLDALSLTARIGFHVGPVTLRENRPEDVARGAKPVEVEGLSKPLAARIMTLARGGQTLLSASARGALLDLSPEHAEIECHGYYRLKGVEAPVEVFELGVSGSSFLPPADVDKAYRVVRIGQLWQPLRDVRHNLPAERDIFVGRAVELHALSLKLDSGVRLLSILGAAGTGKTRFARRYGLAWLGDWPGGVYFCDLSEARSVDGICFAVAAALGVLLGKDDPVVQLGHAIAGRGRCLLILDNFEQVATHARTTVGSWVDRAANAHFVVTSRERLHLPGEESFPIEPLPLDCEAMELFAVRAAAQQPEFVLNPTNRAAVAEVVRLVDGLPLAIELAAARIAVLSPSQLVQRMKGRFHLLAGIRGAAARQATLKAAIDWSWDLLLLSEQAALAQCSIFEGGFTLPAAEAVLDLAAWPEASDAMDVVQALVDKSLLRTWVPAQQGRYDIDEPHFGMYISIHEYAAGKLRASGPAAVHAAERRHGAYFSTFGTDDAIESLSLHGGGPRRRALALELDNLVVACRRAVARRDGQIAVGSYRAAWEVLDLRGPYILGVTLGDEVLASPEITGSLRSAALLTRSLAARRAGQTEVAVVGFARALADCTQLGERRREGLARMYLGNLHREQGRFAQALDELEAALRIAREVGHRRVEAAVLGDLGNVHKEQGRLEPARADYEESLRINRELGNRRLEGLALTNLGLLHSESGRFAEARSHYDAALAIQRELDNRGEEALALNNLGILLFDRGQRDEALSCYQRSLALAREVGARRLEGFILGNLCCFNLVRGNYNEAELLGEASLTIHREVGNRRSEGIMLGNMASLHRDQGRNERALELYERALTIHRNVGNRRGEGTICAGMAEILFDQGRSAEASELLRNGETLLRELGEVLELALLICTRGCLDVAAGNFQAAQVALVEVETAAKEISAGPDSLLCLKTARLRAAIGG